MLWPVSHECDHVAVSPQTTERTLVKIGKLHRSVLSAVLVAGVEVQRNQSLNMKSPPGSFLSPVLSAFAPLRT